jgi:uncharacterized protein (DUF952 family)
MFCFSELKQNTLPEPSERSLMHTSLPSCIYKIVTKSAWDESASLGHVKLPSADEHFIHFSMEEQLERILSKYWSGVSEYVILKIDPTRLPGRLIFEANPGGSAKYYHLYEGSIPLQAVIDVSLKSASHK